MLSLLLFLAASTAAATEAVPGTAKTSLYQVTKIESDLQGDILNLSIVGNSEPAYTVSERFSPFRAVLDIANAAFDKSINLQSQLIADNPFISLKTSVLSEQDPSVTRFEFTIADSHDYKITRDGFVIKVQVAPAAKETAAEKPGTSPSPAAIPAISDIVVKTTPSATSVTFVSSAPIAKYTTDTITGNANETPKMYIDIENVDIAQLVREKRIGTSVDKIRVIQQGDGARFIFDSATASLFDYTVADNAGQVVVTVNENPALPGQTASAGKNQKSSQPTDKTLDSLIGETETILATEGKKSTVKTAATDPKLALEDTFSFAGYDKQRISVDFYKIDLHNVFRLFRQFTDINIIVDEAVTGSLTLALTDVPWDFALDIICNLKDLKKEERFNTIVIYPNKKTFVWPDRLEDNLAVEADAEIVEQDALIIEQSANLPKEVIQAQEILRNAQIADENENFEEAAELYEQAYRLWPANAKISNRLATLYLVSLGVNAKAVHYAKESLKQEPGNNRAALYAAIGSANMQRNAEALEYFTQSISGNPPMKEALISFSTFCETSGQSEQAIKLLDRYNASYGETMDTMIAKARIYDKLGNSKMAITQYKALLASGFPLPPDLKQYIHGRMAASSF
ncbi:type IV pilus assembly protein PilQ [Desulfoprunum benzoelyticum]|uniref:Type IV pilus assembly protein PilQ n=1 Tax=Desulfoprunum benzoelyticum TaxID=1506996 RepID=A0A840UST2_9BACT|nr:type IV pilus assembly protein PilQ [Desulfoprunum benzoelyticum]